MFLDVFSGQGHLGPCTIGQEIQGRVCSTPKSSTDDPRWGWEPRRCRAGHHRPAGADIPRNKTNESHRRETRTENILPRTVQMRSMSLDRSKRLRSRDDFEEEAPPSCKLKMQKKDASPASSTNSPAPPASTSSPEQSSSQQENTLPPAQDQLQIPPTSSPLAAAQANVSNSQDSLQIAPVNSSPETTEPASSQEVEFTLVTNKRRSQKTTASRTPTTMRPRTGVSLAPRPPTNPSLAFKIEASTCFPNPYEALMLLQKDPSLSFTALPWRDSTFIPTKPQQPSSKPRRLWRTEIWTSKPSTRPRKPPKES